MRPANHLGIHITTGLIVIQINTALIANGSRESAGFERQSHNPYDSPFGLQRRALYACPQPHEVTGPVQTSRPAPH